MPKYTVVMPARNAEQTISIAIRSVLRSFPEDTQVVVWDDGSSDDTAGVADAIHRTKVVVHSSPTSVGGGVARQNILDLTDSEIVVNQDADDITLPWRHRHQAGLLRNADFVFSAVLRFSKGTLWCRPSLPLPYTPQDVAIALLIHNPLSNPTMIAKRAAIEDIGGYTNSKVAQDYELWLRAAVHGKQLRRSGLPCLAYRLSERQVSRQPGYAERIQSNPLILAAYDRLADKLLPTIGAPARRANAGERPVPISVEHIDALVMRMSPYLRPHYRRLMRTGRYGDLGSVAVDQRRVLDD